MSTPRTKQRHSNHIAGDAGVKLVTSKFPEEWVVREIHPDYALDLHVETFRTDPLDPRSANTLGEHFYVQVKTVEKLEHAELAVWDRLNVAKFQPDRSHSESIQIEVVKYPLDTSTLLTVETMGAAVPALLCVAELSTEKVYYLCLNDYITKVLLPNNSSYEGQRSVTVMIPAWNVLDLEDPGFAYIWLLARRGKFYAAFNSFAYQYNELSRMLNDRSAQVDGIITGFARVTPEILQMSRVLLRASLRLAIWEAAGPGYWSPLGEVRSALQTVQDMLPGGTDAIPAEDAGRFVRELTDAFRRAANLGQMYEELVREWRLPTSLAALTDYSEGNKYNPPGSDSRA